GCGTMWVGWVSPETKVSRDRFPSAPAEATDPAAATHAAAAMAMVLFIRMDALSLCTRTPPDRAAPMLNGVSPRPPPWWQRGRDLSPTRRENTPGLAPREPKSPRTLAYSARRIRFSALFSRRAPTRGPQ